MARAAARTWAVKRAGVGGSQRRAIGFRGVSGERDQAQRQTGGEEGEAKRR